nr:type-F conjugative transfer system secretin TraK [Legionella bozemanae]
MPKKLSVYKGQKTQLKRLLTVQGNRMRGEIFELKNITNQPIDAKESWFNWPGTKGVALAKNHLAPFETTRLYRIS